MISIMKTEGTTERQNLKKYKPNQPPRNIVTTKYMKI